MNLINIKKPQVGKAVFLLDWYPLSSASIAEITQPEDEPNGRPVPMGGGDNLTLWFVRLDHEIYWNESYPSIERCSIYWTDKFGWIIVGPSGD